MDLQEGFDQKGGFQNDHDTKDDYNSDSDIDFDEKRKEDIENYFDMFKKLQKLLLNYINDIDPPECEVDFNDLIEFMNEQKIQKNRSNMIKFLRLLLNIANNHHRQNDFFVKICRILIYYSNEIRQFLTNIRIFQFFSSNKKIVHFLLKNKIIEIEKTIVNYMMNKKEMNGIYYCHFFLPEIKEFIEEEKFKKLIQNDQNFFDQYEEKRLQGENDSIICSLIRQDSVEEFISYVNYENIPLSSRINYSIFETNSMLLNKNQPTLIEYAAFYGSIEIFQFLRLNNVELKSRLWFYAIHSNNAEFIHLLEDCGLMPDSFILCFIECIKCHHNEIANYFINKYDVDVNCESAVASCFKYYNFDYFPSDLNNYLAFFYLCQYNYSYIIDLIIEVGKNEFEKILAESNNLPNLFHDAANKNKLDLIYYLLLKEKKICNECFKNCNLLKKISIPFSVTSIGDYSFNGCLLLSEIIIPDSVISIGNYSFNKCSLLKQITIPNSVTEIGEGSFIKCSSLKEISIFSSITSIEKNTFNECSSLTKITLPSSVVKIGVNAFNKCSSLEQISIPSSVTFIGGGCFRKCSLLKKITIPSSLKEIEFDVFEDCFSLEEVIFVKPSSLEIIKKNSFSKCTSLKQITISSSVKEIGPSSFFDCSSLKEILFDDQSSLQSIGAAAFLKCSSLSNFIFPKSISTIANAAFMECSSINEICIPSSVTIINENTFQRCLNLKKINFEIPSSLKSIENDAFKECSSLEKIVIPSSVVTIKKNSFQGCSSLKTVIFDTPSSLTSIEDKTFEGCSSLSQIVIPSSVTVIKSESFRSCSSLEKVTFENPSSLRLIEKQSFRNCPSLKQILIPSSLNIDHSCFNTKIEIIKY